MVAIANTKQGIVLVQLCPRRRSAQNQSRILKNEFEKQFKIQVQEVTELTNFEMETVLEWSPILATAEDIEVAMAKEGWNIGELYSLIPAARLEASMKYQCYDHLAPLSSLDKALAIKDTGTMKAIMPDIAPSSPNGWLQAAIDRGQAKDKANQLLVPGRAPQFIFTGMVCAILPLLSKYIFSICNTPCSALCIEPFFVFQTVEAISLLLLRGSFRHVCFN